MPPTTRFSSLARRNFKAHQAFLVAVQTAKEAKPPKPRLSSVLSIAAWAKDEVPLTLHSFNIPADA
jgi:hypothetical protein